MLSVFSRKHLSGYPICVVGICNASQVCLVTLAPPTCSPQCLNGGKCTSQNTCICKPGFSGPTCAIRKCHLDLNFYLNCRHSRFFFLSQNLLAYVAILTHTLTRQFSRLHSILVQHNIPVQHLLRLASVQPTSNNLHQSQMTDSSVLWIVSMMISPVHGIRERRIIQGIKVVTCFW